MTQAQRDIRRKQAALEHAVRSKNVSQTCRFFGISRDTFYEWRRAFERDGTAGLVNRKRGPKYPERRQVPAAVQAQILELRRAFGFGPKRIAWCLARYHGVTVSPTGVWRTLKRHGVNRLPPKTPIRSLASWRRYEKRTPGHHVQIDVKFLDLVTPAGKRVRRFQYTAIDDATRIRALKISTTHTQFRRTLFTTSRLSLGDRAHDAPYLRRLRLISGVTDKFVPNLLHRLPDLLHPLEQRRPDLIRDTLARSARTQPPRDPTKFA